ncbi:hypothetical protein NHF40_12365 [Maricaulaceae bacterium EIL42A08]|nr:hypothetical protein [Maricaulaceae bacterium EIL42A08]
MSEMSAEAVFVLGLALGLGFAGLAYLGRRTLWYFTSGMFRALSFPFRFSLRRLGIGRKVNAEAVGSDSVEAIKARAAGRHQTLTEQALGVGGDRFEQEEAHMNRQGFIFRWLSVRVGFMRMPEELDDRTAEEYGALAEQFLGREVPITADQRALFEDIEGQVIAGQFQSSDAGVIYLLNEARKIMNANVMILSALFSVILGIVLVGNVFAHQFGLIRSLGLFPDGLAFMDSQTASSLVFGAASCLVGAMVMWALYYAEFAPYQRNTAREMANLLTRYLARVNDHYRTAVGKARSVTVGEEREPKRLGEKAKLWTLNMTWIALRVFFVETYVRNVVFQIRRNSNYYLMFVPLGVVIATGVILGGLAAFTGLAPFQSIYQLGWVFAVLFFLVAALYSFFLSNALNALDEIDQGEWISFHTLKLNHVLGEVVGKYAEDVGYWKNRIGGGGL